VHFRVRRSGGLGWQGGAENRGLVGDSNKLLWRHFFLRSVSPDRGRQAGFAAMGGRSAPGFQPGGGGMAQDAPQLAL